MDARVIRNCSNCQYRCLLYVHVLQTHSQPIHTLILIQGVKGGDKANADATTPPSLVSVVTRMALKLARPFAAMTVAADPSNPSRQMRVVVVAWLVGRRRRSVDVIN